MITTAPREMVAPAIDRPCSRKLEDLLRHIGWSLQPEADRPGRTIEDFVTAFRKAFKLSLPIAPQMTKFLSEAGIEMNWLEERKGVNVDASYDYDAASQKWQIYVRSGLGIFEPRAILHEVYEIFFWRCYHVIPWFKDWAIQNKIYDPHDKADDYASLMMLPRRKFCNLAKKLDYDIWRLASHCQVHPNSCFNAVTRYASFKHPFFHMNLSFGALPDQLSMLYEENTLQAKIVGKAYKSPQNEEYGLNWEYLEPEEKVRWQLMDCIKDLSHKGEFLDIPSSNSSHLAHRNGKTIFAETDCFAGCVLQGPVSVIARPGKNSHVYVQVVPSGYSSALQANPEKPFMGWPKLLARDHPDAVD